MRCCSTSAVAGASALRLRAVSFSPNCNCNCSWMKKMPAKSNIIRCEVAINAVEESTTSQIGARVKVKVPLKVYHVPKIPELDLTGMEGEIKQYVGLWKGKRISANLPYKVQFVTEIQGRGPVKFFAHLKEDEFDIV
ncbi:hypothetical protein Fmac_016997 [Flemingia macrophylla]|uniref:Ferredoxin thioredoxin reductase alpha chain domain-containing protein n=1 Tax=Flemingia macrophylla TaxID=520843 RepID=A0ABD1MJ10_9FABA